MNKKMIAIIITLVVAVFALTYFVGSGFLKRNDVALSDYSVSEDGTKLIFNASVTSSMGYIRGFKDKGGGVKPHYLTFYSTFGGINSAFRSKYEFELDLGESDTEIYFNRENGGYELVLKKDTEMGKWVKP